MLVLLAGLVNRAISSIADNFAVTTNKSANSEFREGDSARLECKVEKYGNAAKKPSIQWYDGNTILSGSATQVVDGARTTFTNVAVKLLSPADNGKIFTCRMSFTARDNIILPTGFTTERSTGVMDVLCKYGAGLYSLIFQLWVKSEVASYLQFAFKYIFGFFL